MREIKLKYKSCFIVGLVVFIFIFSCNSSNQKKDLPWSTRMADSEMKRNPEPWMIDFREAPKWEYTQGLVLKAILQVWQSTGDEKYLQYVKTYYDQFVDSSGSIMTYDLEEYKVLG